MPWVAAIAVVAKGIGDRQKQRKQNRYARNAAGMLSPSAIKGGIQEYNPQLYQAAYGKNPFAEWQKPTDNWADWVDQQSAMSGAVNQNPISALFKAPGYIDPRIMNFSLNQNAAQSQSSMQAGISQMGRSAMMGGMADAFTMASRAREQATRAGIMQNYDIDRANRMRSDIGQSQAMLNQAYGQVASTQGQAAGHIASQRAPESYLSIGANAVSSGLGAYGSMQGIAGQTGQVDNMLPGGSGGGPTQTGYTPPNWSAMMGQAPSSAMPATSTGGYTTYNSTYPGQYGGR